MNENELARIVTDTAYQVHRELGPGLFESVYHAVLLYELQNRGLQVASEIPIAVQWKGLNLDVGFKADLVVNELLIVEIKSIESLAPVHKKQLLTYLRLTKCRLGLLINFGEELIKNGIRRVVNGLEDFNSK